MNSGPAPLVIPTTKLACITGVKLMIVAKGYIISRWRLPNQVRLGFFSLGLQGVLFIENTYMKLINLILFVSS